MERKCNICGNEVIATNGASQKYCSRACYYKSMVGKLKKRKPAIDKLKERTEVNLESGCWIWTGGKLRGGYGSLRADGRTRAAHRVSFEIVRGPIPDGMDLLHSCDNPACVNPDHLSVGTDVDNSNDKIAKGRQARLKGSANGNAKLTEADVIAIRDSKGATCSELMERYGASSSQITKIRSGRSWSHLTGREEPRR